MAPTCCLSPPRIWRRCCRWSSTPAAANYRRRSICARRAAAQTLAALAARRRHFRAGLPAGRHRRARLFAARRRAACGPGSSMPRYALTATKARGPGGAVSTRWCRPRAALMSPKPKRSARAKPKELPAQELDHATGYLLAFAVMTALKRQAEEGGSWHVRALAGADRLLVAPARPHRRHDLSRSQVRRRARLPGRDRKRLRPAHRGASRRRHVGNAAALGAAERAARYATRRPGRNSGNLRLPVALREPHALRHMNCPVRSGQHSSANAHAKNRKKQCRQTAGGACRGRSQNRARQIAGVESQRPLFRPRRSGHQARSRPRRRRMRRLRGRLQGQARRAWRAAPDGGAALAAAVRRYEAIDDLMGRLGSYAGLVHAGDTRRSGAHQILRRHAGAHHRGLARIFCSSRSSSTASTTRCSRPRWPIPRSAITGRGSRTCARYRPYQLEDRVEQLFHEKSVTGYSAWNRQFDETIAKLRFKVGGQIARHRADAQSDAGSLAATKRKAAAQALAKTFKDNVQDVHADHQYARQGQGNLRPLARLRRHRRRAPSVEPGRARSGRCAGRGGARRLSAAVAPLLCAEGEMVRQEAAAALGSQRAAAEGGARARSAGPRRMDTVLTAYGAFSPQDGGDRRALFRRALDRRAGAAGQGAGRLRASDRAVGASLCAAQLSGQAARRDDAGA